MSGEGAISCTDYQHPDDKRMLDDLNRRSILREKATQFIRYVDEPQVSGCLTANGVRTSSIQFPGIYHCAVELAGKFDIKIPKVFIVNEPRPNAFTHGFDDQTFVGLAHSLVTQLNKAELKFILGHEIGHIQCRHVLYTTMIHWTLTGAQDVPTVSNDDLRSMTAWLRVAELSADRAGLLACGSEESAYRSLLTMLLGCRELAEKVDIQEYVADQTCSLNYNPLALHRQTVESHPFMPVRICELMKFARSKVYEVLTGMSESVEIELN